MSSIGLLNEKSLHASLKKWYAKPGDDFEVKVDGYFIDIVRDNWLIEIQTGNFSSIRKKLNNILEQYKVRLIYPVAQEKWIIKLPKSNRDKTIRRKSPKQAKLDDVFVEALRIPQFLAHPNFSLEVLLIKEEEVRKYVENRNWRRKGWTTVERRLIEVIDRKVFDDLYDWRLFIPEKFDEFTAKDLAGSRKIPVHLAQKMVYCLKHAQIIEQVGKRSRAFLYRTKI